MFPQTPREEVVADLEDAREFILEGPWSSHRERGYGQFLVELKDVTLESRTTEMLENRVLERTAELTRANERLTRTGPA